MVAALGDKVFDGALGFLHGEFCGGELLVLSVLGEFGVLGKGLGLEGGGDDGRNVMGDVMRGGSKF